MLLLKLVLSIRLMLSSMLISMTNSMFKLLNLSPRSLTWKTTALSLLANYPEVAGDSTDPLPDAVDIVTDSINILKAEAVVMGGDVPGTLASFLNVPNVPKLPTPRDHKLRVGVAHPGVSAMDQGVGDCVGPQLVEVDHPQPVVLISCKV